MEITYYGHSTFGVKIGDKHLLFDPFITYNEKAKHINISAIPADYILVSHGHQDHIADVEAIAMRTGAKLVSSFEVVNWFAKKGISNNHPMNHGGKWKFDFGTVHCVNAVHSSAMPDGSYGGNPLGFVIETAEGTFYYSGDTALTLDMQLIAAKHELSFAMLCMGDNFTMDVADALRAATFINCREIIGMHYDTFGYIVINHQEAVEMFALKEKNLILMEIGETIAK